MPTSFDSGFRVLNGSQRLFCEGVVRGLSLTDAYHQAYPRASWDTCQNKGSDLGRRLDIRFEIGRLRDKAIAMGGGDLLTALEKRMFLARVVRLRFPTFEELEYQHELQCSASSREGGRGSADAGPGSAPGPALALDLDLIQGVIPGRRPQILIPHRLIAIHVDNLMAGHGHGFWYGPRQAGGHRNVGHRLHKPTRADRWEQRLVNQANPSRPGPEPRPLSEADLRFCDLILAGMKVQHAYRAVFPATPMGLLRLRAHRLWCKPAVQARIFELREARDAAQGSAVLTLLEKRRFLARIVRMNGFRICPVRDADLIKRITPTPWGPRYHLYNKLAAIRLDNLLAGHAPGRMAGLGTNVRVVV